MTRLCFAGGLQHENDKDRYRLWHLCLPDCSTREVAVRNVISGAMCVPAPCVYYDLAVCRVHASVYSAHSFLSHHASGLKPHLIPYHRKHLARTRDITIYLPLPAHGKGLRSNWQRCCSLEIIVSAPQWRGMQFSQTKRATPLSGGTDHGMGYHHLQHRDRGCGFSGLRVLLRKQGGKSDEQVSKDI